MWIWIFCIFLLSRIFTGRFLLRRMCQLKMVMVRHNCMSQNNQPCQKGKKPSNMLSSQIHLFNLFCFKNGKYIEKVHATELQSYLWQFEQIPLTTMLIFSRVKWVGRFTDGTGMSLRQYVCLHLEQRKWTCKSLGWHWQVSLHNAYFTEPVPSSMLWMSLFSSKVFKVL